MKLEPVGYVIHQLSPHMMLNYAFTPTIAQARELAYNAQMQYRRIMLSDPVPVYEVPSGWTIIKTDELSTRNRFKRAWLAFRGVKV